MDANQANTIKSRAPFRPSRALRSALRERGKAVGSITYFYSSKNGKDVLFSFVNDIDALLARIATYGWKAQGTPQPIAGGSRAGTRVIYVVGPDGATIEFMQPPTSVREH